MKATPRVSENKPLPAVALACAGIGLLALLIAEQGRGLDREIFERLALAFGETESRLGQLMDAQTSAGWLSSAGLANGVGFFVLAGATVWTAFKLPAVPRAFALVSLLVLSLLYQWNLWHLFHLPGHPLGFLTAIICGVAAGQNLRTREMRRRENEAHYYELKLRNQELLDTRLALLKQDEMERRILAADLHDQVLNDLKQVVQRFESYVKSPDEATAATIRTLSNQVMKEIREVMDSLSPSVLEHLGLGAAIEDCLRRGSDRAGFKVRFRNKLDSTDLDGLSLVEQSLLYRLVQESITNVCKHAGASTVRASMEKEDDSLVIRIADDGKGIDPSMMRADSRGLKYMRYRADLIGATIGWRAGDDGKGTTVEIRVSLAVKAQPVAGEEETGRSGIAANQGSSEASR